MVRGSLTEEVTFKKRPEGKESVSHVDNSPGKEWGRQRGQRV